MNKNDHIQLRLSKAEKKQLQAMAKQAGMSLSAWILQQTLPQHQQSFQQLVHHIFLDESPASFAALNDFLTSLSKHTWEKALSQPPLKQLTSQQVNIVAAMIEHAGQIKQLAPPTWTKQIAPLTAPWFATSLKSLRPYLLRVSPAAFKQRNLFVDASIGDRV